MNIHLLNFPASLFTIIFRRILDNHISRLAAHRILPNGFWIVETVFNPHFYYVYLIGATFTYVCTHFRRGTLVSLARRCSTNALTLRDKCIQKRKWLHKNRSWVMRNLLSTRENQHRALSYMSSQLDPSGNVSEASVETTPLGSNNFKPADTDASACSIQTVTTYKPDDKGLRAVDDVPKQDGSRALFQGDGLNDQGCTALFCLPNSTEEPSFMIPRSANLALCNSPFAQMGTEESRNDVLTPYSPFKIPKVNKRHIRGRCFFTSKKKREYCKNRKNAPHKTRSGKIYGSTVGLRV